MPASRLTSMRRRRSTRPISPSVMSARPGSASSSSTRRARTSSFSTWARTSSWTPPPSTRPRAKSLKALSSWRCWKCRSRQRRERWRLAVSMARGRFSNPAPARALPREIFANVDYLTPGRERAAHSPRPPGPRLRLIARARGGTAQTRGSDRLRRHARADGRVDPRRRSRCMVPAVPVDVVDTTGAGDAFNSGSPLRWRKGGASWTR